MKLDTFKCDGCGIQKQESNHWYRGYKLTADDGVVIIKWDAAPPVEEVEDFEAHLCGAGCATGWLSKSLL